MKVLKETAGIMKKLVMCTLLSSETFEMYQLVGAVLMSRTNRLTATMKCLACTLFTMFIVLVLHVSMLVFSY